MSSEFFTEDDCDCSSRMIGDPTTGKAFMECTSISLDKANRLIKARGLVVGGFEYDNGKFGWDEDFDKSDTHRALLIAIEPIERDSAEKIVADLLTAYNRRNEPMGLPELIARAERLGLKGQADE